jgi:hypothetical protein
MCNCFFFVYLEYFNFLYANILPCMLVLGLFLWKVYEATLLRLDSPFCVKAFLLPKENKKIFFSTPLFYFFQNLIIY